VHHARTSSTKVISKPHSKHNGPFSEFRAQARQQLEQRPVSRKTSDLERRFSCIEPAAATL
jgi:hypothetical protein